MKFNHLCFNSILGMFLMAIMLFSCEGDTAFTPKNDGALTPNAATTTSAALTPVQPPFIKVFIPSSGYAGTAKEEGSFVQIFGGNFGDDPTIDVDEVRINGIKTDILQGEDNRILVLVPPGATTGRVTVSAHGFVATSEIDFIVGPRDAPIFEFFTPEAGGEIGSTVTLFGQNFDDVNIQNNEVRFNGVSAQVTAASERQITTIVPEGATTGQITITKNGFTVPSPLIFIVTPKTVKPLAIQSIRPNIFTTKEVNQGTAAVIITGTGFDVMPSKNRVRFDGNFTPGFVLFSSETELFVLVPPFTTTGPVEVFANDQHAISPFPIIVVDQLLEENEELSKKKAELNRIVLDNKEEIIRRKQELSSKRE